MKLIIAEKPSLARNIVSAIGTMKKSGGFYVNNEYIVTWVFGHLFSLADIEHYNPNPDGSRWSMKNIPCFPQRFDYELRHDKDGRIDTGVANQFNTIKTLANRDDVDTIVNAGDSDREGEIIVRICVENAFKDNPNNNKAFKRLWLPDQTPETISEALKQLPDESEYVNLANEGYARTYIDWLYGVNLTRFATLKTGTLMRVGRVIVPIVKAIYDRDMAIRSFVPEKYYAICSKEGYKLQANPLATDVALSPLTRGVSADAQSDEGEVIELTSKVKIKGNELPRANKFCDMLNANEAVVVDKKTKKDTLTPGKLYSLTKLQNVLGKRYKMSMSDSLKIVQDLYEKGYVTYPRTNSEYLATAEKDKVKKIISGVKSLGYNIEFKDKKTIFDDKKIESHSALTPTYKLPKKADLSENEFKVYSTILRRFVAVFCAEDCKIEKTELKINVDHIEQFTLKGNTMITKGWTRYDDYNKKDKTLPILNVGDRININFKPTEKETTPPKHYTIETLNNYLKNPFREEKAKANEEGNEDDAEEYRAIFEGLELGTEATRTGIIDNARSSEYISLKKDVYTILPAGEKLIESLAFMNISMDKYKTSELGQSLKKVFRGEITIEDSVALAKKEIKAVFENQGSDKLELDTDYGFVGDIVGCCPYCSCDVIRTKFGYGCNGYKENGCRFNINGVICGRVISKNNVKCLLETGKTSKIVGFTSKRTGKTFDAVLSLQDGKISFEF